MMITVQEQAISDLDIILSDSVEAKPVRLNANGLQLRTILLSYD